MFCNGLKWKENKDISGKLAQGVVTSSGIHRGLALGCFGEPYKTLAVYPALL